MSKKINNKLLLYIFAALILIFIFAKWYQKYHTESTLNVELVKIDTAKVSKILLYPLSENHDEVSFIKEGKSWKLQKGKVTAEPEQNAVQNLLNVLSEIKTKRLASRDKKKWSEYQVTDSAATRVKVYEGNEKVVDLYVGKFTYQQNNRGYGGMYGGGAVSGTSFIRVAEEDEVYAVDGFLTFSFNQQFNTFRNQTIAKFEKANVNKLTFTYPADSSFTLELKDKIWYCGNEKADSAKVSDYLNTLSYKNASSFVDNYSAVGMPVFQLSVDGKDMKSMAISTYSRAINDYIINSSLNPKAWFSSDDKGLITDIFKSKKSFFVSKKKK